MAKQKGIVFEEIGAPKAARGKNFLFAIAINKYENHDELFNCVDDAKELVKVLQERYGFEKDETITLFDEKASLENIYEKLEDIQERARPLSHNLTETKPAITMR